MSVDTTARNIAQSAQKGEQVNMSDNNTAMIATNAATLMPALSIQQAVDRYELLTQFVGKLMKAGADFGEIPGTNKPTLLKPGAEKLLTFFGLTKRFTILEKMEDWRGVETGEPFFYYLYRCGLYNGDQLIAESDGSCNSFESKYRYRKAERVCPACGKAAIIKGKAEYGGGWLCFKKKDGCNAKFDDGDPEIEGQQVGRVANPDIADQVNTIQKMAQKRALIAATLLAVNASQFFTQDIEDMAIEGEIIEGEVVRQPSKSSGFDPKPKTLGDLVTPKQLWMIRSLAREAGLEAERECEARFDMALEEISKKAASMLVDYLKGKGEQGGGNGGDSGPSKQSRQPDRREESKPAPRGLAGQIVALCVPLNIDEEGLINLIREKFEITVDGVDPMKAIAQLDNAQQETLVGALKAKLSSKA